MSDAQPTGRNDVTAALVEAATTLFTSQAPGDVTIRSIAAAAGVNHGLVHRHIGTKLDLARLVVDAASARVKASIVPSADPVDVVMQIIAGAMSEPVFSRVLSWSVLEGLDQGGLRTSSGIVTEAAAILQRAGVPEPRTVTADLAVRTLGWSTYEDYLFASGLLGEDVEAARRRHLDLIERDLRRLLSA